MPMIRRFLSILILLSGTFSALEAQNYEIPRLTNHQHILEIKHSAYTCFFSTEKLTPVCVAWCLTPDRINGSTKRTDFFDVDPAVKDERYRVMHSDYSGSHYDRGHMCPAADNRQSLKAMTECFYMTNMCPQHHALNVGGWNALEIQCRSWARNYKKIYVCAGPIYNSTPPRTIGKKRKIAVPDAFYKVVLMKGKTTKAIGFIYKNEDAKTSIRSHAVSVDQVERTTGIDFFSQLDDAVEKKVESECNPSAWNI